MQLQDDLARQKQEARNLAKSQRDVLQQKFLENSKFDLDTAVDFIEGFAGAAVKSIAAYWPIGSEFETRSLIAILEERGHTICLPVIVGKGKPLIFRKWAPSVRLELAAFNVPVPPIDAEVIAPEILLLPLLAFDDKGYRLGYGGGFYDRTLENLRRTETVKAIGMAFSGQYMENIPTGDYDQPMDAVITEEFLKEFT